jgi:hypothetical protein
MAIECSEYKTDNPSDSKYCKQCATPLVSPAGISVMKDWLEHAALNRGFINHPFLNEHDPFLDNIRGEPRFKKLIEKVKNKWENFEV